MAEYKKARREAAGLMTPAARRATALNMLAITGLAFLMLVGVTLDAIAGGFPVGLTVIYCSIYLVNCMNIWLTARLCALSEKKRGGAFSAALLPALAPTALFALAVFGVNAFLKANAMIFGVIIMNLALSAAIVVLSLWLWVMLLLAAQVFVSQWVIYRMERGRAGAIGVRKLLRESFRHMGTPIRQFFGFFLELLAAAVVTGLLVWGANYLKLNVWVLRGVLAAGLVWMLGYGVWFWPKYHMTWMCYQRGIMRGRGLL